eukprot:6470178-Amphidinium_carterae.3
MMCFGAGSCEDGWGMVSVQRHGLTHVYIFVAAALIVVLKALFSESFFVLKLPGTVAHRLGETAFAAQRGTVSGKVLALEAAPIQAAAEDKAKQAITLHKRLLTEEQSQHQARLADMRATTDFCKAQAQQNTCRMLDLSRSLQDLGPWLCLPGGVCAKAFNVEEICKELHAEHREWSLARLAQDWADRHVGIRQPSVQQKNVKGLRLPKCLVEGFCHCRRSPAGLLAAWMRDKVKVAMKEMFKQRMHMLMDGYIVFLWSGKATKASTAMVPQVVSTRVTHVPLMYLQPIRPTLLELVPAADDQVRLQDAFPALEGGARKQAVDEVFTFTVGMAASGVGPAFHNFLSFIGTLDPELEWWLCPMQVSDRLRPSLQSEGKVQVLARKGDDGVCVWHGHAAEANGRARPFD